MPESILLIEDDPEIGELVRLHLTDEGYLLEWETRGDTGLTRALEERWALVILDLMLPGMNGLDVCRRLRAESRRMPILMLTAKSEEIDKVLGLELGADDYLTKPFSVRELIARVKAILRRTRLDAEEADAGTPPTVRFGPLTVQFDKRRVLLDEQAVELTAKEFDLLALFAAHPGKPFNREQLLNQVWGYSYAGYEHTVNSHINRLRAKIEADPSHPRYILTVWGFGYRFAEPEEWAQ